MGDAVLHAIGNTLSSKGEGQNIVGYRYGGKGLAVTCRGEPAASATDVAESIVQKAALMLPKA
jgi:PleD family two-component response regulator